MTAHRVHVSPSEAKRLIRDASVRGLQSERQLRAQLEQNSRGVPVAGGRLVLCGQRHFLLQAPGCVKTVAPC